MAGHHGSGPRADSGFIGPTDAAAILGVSVDLVRKRTAEGLIPCEITATGRRLYLRTDVDALIGSPEIARRPPGVRRTRIVADPIKLTVEDERECLRIAEAAATVWTKKIPALDWDEALSDATFGVATALAHPSPDVPWNASAWQHAQWHIMKGIRKASGVNSRAFDAGMRYEDLPEHLRPPVSLEAAAEVGHYAPSPLDSTAQLVERLAVEGCLTRLDRTERICLVNAAVHHFDDSEIAADLGIKIAAVRAARTRAIRIVQHELAAQGIAWDRDEAAPAARTA